MKLANQSLLKFLGFNTQGDLGPWTFYTDKSNGLVFFAKSPPLKPPSPLQTRQRHIITTVAGWWSGLSEDVRAKWELATKRLRLYCTGYNLFIWYHTTHDRPTLATIERLSKLTLVDD